MPRVARGHVEQLPSGSFRAVVYVGVDPLTRRPVYLKATARTEKQAQVELGKLLGKAYDGRRPESDATVAKLLEEYVQIAGWDLSTRESNLGYIRRTLRPALGSMQVRKVRGPLLNTFYARLMRCGNLACTGKPFTEHRDVPDLRPDPADPRLEWQQAADRVPSHCSSGVLNFAAHSPDITSATEDAVLRASNGPDRRDRSSTDWAATCAVTPYQH